MIVTNSRQAGFTLLEIAIVVFIISLLFGFTIALFPVQQELKQYRKADTEIDEIIEQLIAYAQVNGRLPCPDTGPVNLAPQVAGNGFENLDGGGIDCAAWSGNVPGKTLALNARYNRTGVMLDPWLKPYIYQVSSDTSGGTAAGDFTFAGEMRAVGITNLSPDLNVCTVQPLAHTAAAPSADPACDAATIIVNNAVAVILSLGNDQGNDVSDIQSENTDGLDTVFVSTAQTDDYDDIVKWLSPHRLFSKMIEADQLP